MGKSEHVAEYWPLAESATDDSTHQVNQFTQLRHEEPKHQVHEFAHLHHHSEYTKYDLADSPAFSWKALNSSIPGYPMTSEQLKKISTELLQAIHTIES